MNYSKLDELLNFKQSSGAWLEENCEFLNGLEYEKTFVHETLILFKIKINESDFFYIKLYNENLCNYREFLASFVSYLRTYKKISSKNEIEVINLILTNISPHLVPDKEKNEN